MEGTLPEAWKDAHITPIKERIKKLLVKLWN